MTETTRPKGVLPWRILTIALLAVVIGGSILSALGFASSNADLRHQLNAASSDDRQAHHDTDAATANAQKLYQQLLSIGATPQAQKPSDVVSGPSGATGATGASGRSVLSVECQPNGLWTVTFDDGSIQQSGGICVGQVGASGATGPSGQNGANGLDSTVPGPSGPAGPQGDQGPPGSAGTNGTSVTGVTCVTTDAGATAFEFTLTAADGTTTTQDVAGTCTPN